MTRVVKRGPDAINAHPYPEKRLPAYAHHGEINVPTPLIAS